MSDFSPIHIPPREPSAVGGDAKNASRRENADAGEFQAELRKALGDVNQDVKQVANAAPSSLEEAQQAMNAAKNAFSGALHAHQLMQSLIGDPSSSLSEGDREGEG